MDTTTQQRAKHPEQTDDEVFLTNASDLVDPAGDGRSAWEATGWKSKRRGMQAFDSNGQPLKDGLMFPIFVRRAELVAAGLDPDNLEIWPKPKSQLGRRIPGLGRNIENV